MVVCSFYGEPQAASSGADDVATGRPASRDRRPEVPNDTRRGLSRRQRRLFEDRITKGEVLIFDDGCLVVPSASNGDLVAVSRSPRETGPGERRSKTLSFPISDNVDPATREVVLKSGPS